MGDITIARIYHNGPRDYFRNKLNMALISLEISNIPNIQFISNDSIRFQLWMTNILFNFCFESPNLVQINMLKLMAKWDWLLRRIGNFVAPDGKFFKKSYKFLKFIGGS